MTYKWMNGRCEDLGPLNKGEASCYACIFCYIGGQWVGGKFEWISTSRTSRDFKNIKDSYQGWPKDAISMTDRYAFVIIHPDTKKRTNVIAFRR